MNTPNPLWRRIAFGVITLAVGWATLSLFKLYRVHFPNREHAMISPLQDMQTFCVGRYLIDLPRGSVLYRALASAGGEAKADFSAEQPVSRYQFESTVLKRWGEIQKMNVDQLGKPFSQPAERIEVMPDGVVLTFNHSVDYMDEWPGGLKGTQHFYDTEGYLWRNETLYKFSDSATKEETIAAMHRLQLRSNTYIPTAQGFCAAHSFFPGPPEDGESTNFAFNLPTNPPVELRIGTMGAGFKRQDLALFNSADIQASLLRDTRHRIGELDGEEWIDMTASKDYGDIFSSEIEAFWRHGAGESYSRQPSVNVHMTIGVEEKTPPPKFGEFPPKKIEGDIGKEEFLALWDGILKTLRPRPGAF